MEGGGGCGFKMFTIYTCTHGHNYRKGEADALITPLDPPLLLPTCYPHGLALLLSLFLGILIWCQPHAITAVGMVRTPLGAAEVCSCTHMHVCVCVLDCVCMCTYACVCVLDCVCACT